MLIIISDTCTLHSFNARINRLTKVVRCKTGRAEAEAASKKATMTRTVKPREFGNHMAKQGEMSHIPQVSESRCDGTRNLAVSRYDTFESAFVIH